VCWLRCTSAKRLQDLLVRLITEHEQRYGKLN
jgi:hypothetical protein